MLPLEGVKVLAVTQALAGPYAATLLGDLGADVICIERPGVGDTMRQLPPRVNGISLYHALLNRNKRSMELDLSSDQGRELFYKLVERADVVLENLGPGSAESLGISYEILKQRNPRLIYCSISGFGEDGPYKHRPAVDFIIQAESGMLDYNGTPDQICRLNTPVIDLISAYSAAYGILAALIYREKAGSGLKIDVSMFDHAVFMMLNLASFYWLGIPVQPRLGDKYYLMTPYGSYLAKDGKRIAISAARDDVWRRFCSALGLDELISDPRFSSMESRLKHRGELDELIQAKISQRSRDDWIQILTQADVPCGCVNTIPEALEHPQTKHRGLILELDHPKLGKLKLFRNPIKFSQFQLGIRIPPPNLGEHTTQILNELGSKSS